MPRGKNTLYNAIMPQAMVSPTEGLRRHSKINQRRDAMAHRYYFHAVINQYNYETCLDNLCEEFWLSETTVIAELHKRSDFIGDLVEACPGTAELRKKYPFFNWAPKAA